MGNQNIFYEAMGHIDAVNALHNGSYEIDKIKKKD